MRGIIPESPIARNFLNILKENGKSLSKNSDLKVFYADNNGRTSEICSLNGFF